MSNAKPEILVIHVSTPAMVPTLARHFVVHQPPANGDRDAFVAAIASRVRALVVTTFIGGDARLINALPNLEIVVNAGGHYDTTDVAAVRARGLPMTYTPRLTTEDVADVLFGLGLQVARRISEGDRFVRAGRWRQGAMGLGARFNGKRFGVVGLGWIGAATARRAAAFGMEVVYHGPRPKKDVPYRYFADLVEMAAYVDFLALACRSGPATRHIVDQGVIAALGRTGILCSVARGCIDERALVAALRAGALGGAGLDVFENEPHVPAELLTMDNVVLTPHIGSASAEAKQDLVDLVLANLRAHFAGQPLLTPIPDDGHH